MKLIVNKNKIVIYLTNKLVQRQPKNLKPETFVLFFESELYIFDNTKNIIKDQPINLYYLLPKSKDQTLQLM